MPILNETDQALLGSCMDEIRSVVGDISERQLVETIMRHQYDCTKALDDILKTTLAAASTSTAAVDHSEPMETGKYPMSGRNPTKWPHFSFNLFVFFFISFPFSSEFPQFSSNVTCPFNRFLPGNVAFFCLVTLLCYIAICKVRF